VRDAAHPADAGTDVEIPWWHLDASTAFAVVDADVPDEALDACVADAYTQALLFGHDPAESAEWRRATAAYLSWLVTGRWGCEEAVVRQQREPWRGPIAGSAGDGAGGALFLAMISARADGDRGRFLRDLWGLASQKSWHRVAMHGTPDLWEALDRSARVAGDPLKGIVEEISVARFFSGLPERRRSATFPQVRLLPTDAVVPLAIDARWSELPRHLPPVDQEIEPYGSGFAWVDVRGAAAGTQLQVWLRGEYGVEWALVAVQLGEEGEELGRIAAPPRREPRSFVPVDLAEGTVSVLVVVTNLSSRLPDADVLDLNARSFRLILDRAGGADRGEPD
jgi:hypothetical protein